MDLNPENSDQLLIQSYDESEMAVEYIDPMCLSNTIISDGTNGEALSASDGSNVPITFILSDSSISNNESIVTLNPEDLDLAKESISIDDSPSQSHYIIESVQSAQNSYYTIQLPDNGVTQSLDVNEHNNLHSNQDLKKIASEVKDVLIEKIDLNIDSIKHQSDLHVMETTTRLEEFMDVVTTYQCKFCRFSCPWKSGLMSHIRNCHIEANKKAASVEVHNYASVSLKDQRAKKSLKVQELEEHGYSQSPDSKNKSEGNLYLKNSNISSSNGEEDEDVDTPPPFERHLFLCGQCSEGFEFLKDCKNHMIKDHNLKLESADSIHGNPLITARKRGRPRGRPILEKLSSDYKSGSEIRKRISSADTEIDNKECPKRASRPPKLLEEDYFLGVKKRRVRRENGADKPYRCQEKGCGYRFSAESHLDYHLSCHSFSDRPFVCPECGESSENWRGLSVHLWKEHSVDVDLHTCQECGYKTYSPFKLDNHKKIHSEERSFVCDTCGKGFKQLSQLRNHVVIHTDRKNMTEKRWYSEQKCEVCSRTFSDSKCLKKHQQAVHSKLKPFVCTFCGHMSARKAMLQLHMRQHTGEKPFLCEHCEYRTGDHNSLRRHRMRHTGTKPYKCPHCPYACIQAISYKTHLKNKHPGLEGLYACSMCPFRSVSKENYFNHVSDHRRGAIPGVPDIDEEAASIVDCESADQPTQMHLPDNALLRLESMLPRNMSAAQLIFSCLNALSQENGTCVVDPSATISNDGPQTITIQIPSVQEANSDGKFYLTVQQDSTETAVLLPPTDDDICDHDLNIEMEILRPITVMHEGPDITCLDSQTFMNINEEPISSVNSNGPISTQTDSLNATVSKSSNSLHEGKEQCMV